MTAYDLYKLFLAGNLHFSDGTYDFFKYKGVVKASEETFNKSRFKWQFIALTKELNASDCTAILLLYRIFKHNGFKYFKFSPYLFKLARQCLSASLETELTLIESDMRFIINKYEPDFDQVVSTNQSLYPAIYNDYSESKISLETLILYDSYIKRFLVPEASKDIIRWPSELKRIESVRGFVEQIIPRSVFNASVMEKLV